jgi:hypothetical protein
MKKLQIEKERIQRLTNGLDLCFVLDATSSMGWCIKACKEKIVEIIRKGIAIIPQNGFIRVSIVAYRDHCDQDSRIEVFHFANHTEIEQMERFISNIAAKGGGDLPEDVAGAFDQAKKLNWQSRYRALIHVADDPCHGVKYHDYGEKFDDYPNGDPYNLKPEELLQELFCQNVDYYFFKCSNTTDRMTSIFEGVSKTFQRRFKVMEIMDPNKSTASEEFLNLVLLSIRASVTGK